MTLSEWYKAGNHLPTMAKGGKAKKSTRRVSDDPIGDFLNNYEIEKLTKGIAELDAKIKDLEPVPTQVETGSDPMLLDVYPRLKREMEADPHLYEYGTADKKDPSFRRPMLRKPAGRPDDVIPDRLDNDWLEYQLRPRGQTDFSDKIPPGMELPIGKVRSLLEDPSEYYAKGGVSLKNIESREGLAPYGLRHSGEGAKGKGYFGVMPGKRGMVTELSTEAEGVGEHPLIVPTLTREELEHLLAGGDPTESIYNKARQHAEGRKSKGKEAFAGPSELRYPMPEYAKGGEVSGPKGFGLADVAPFVSPMSMKTGGKARTRAGTIAKPTFIDEQLGRTSERLSKLATDPQEAMRDIAAQYFPSPTDSPEEQQRKLEELTLGFTGNIKPVGGATNKIFYRGSTADEKVLRPSSGHEHGVSGISTSPNKEFAGKHGNYIKSYSAKPGEFVDFFDLVKMYNKSFGEDAFLDATDKSVTEFAKSKGYIGSRFNDPFGGEDYRFFDASSLKPVKPDINKAQGGLAHMANGGQGRTRAGTIAKPTFIDEQIDRTRERLSKLYKDPDQALRDIAQQYFPSAADTPEEQQQKLEDLALGFTGSIKSVKGAPAVKAAKAPKIKQTVTDPQRIAFPGIYQRPDVIAAEAASRVAPESLNLKKIFGVTREDLFQMGKGREGNLPGELPGATANPRGSKAAAGVMNKKNEQRIIDAMAEAEKYPALVQGMDPWYVMDPVFQRMVKLLGKDRAIVEYQRLNTLMGMASPGSEVLTEIPRGTAANMLYKQGRFPEFVEHLGKPASQRSTVPKDIVNVPGHMYHKTAQAIPMEQYLETGALQMDSPKVPMYIEASGVPETGFQTRTPVGDAHWSRAVGLADTRGARMLKGKPVIPGASVSTPEMQALAPWWQQNIAAPLGLESVPAQARAWGTFSGQTGVTTPIGAPKIELLADKIAETSRRLGISLEQARDRVLMGEAYAGKKKGGLAHI